MKTDPYSEQRELLALYSLYVELADRVSQRRHQANAFFVSLISGILGIFLAVGKLDGFEGGLLFIVPGVLGVFLCFFWWVHIRSYRQLNSGKFKVIREMEAKLVFPCFEREWELLGAGRIKKRYLRLTVLERWLPIVGGLGFLGMVLMGCYA